VVDLIAGLKDMNAEVDVYDPWADREEAHEEYGLDMLSAPTAGGVYDAVVLAVAHEQFTRLGAAAIRAMGKSNAVFFDVKGVFAKADSDGRL
jgi:UDP-N-acetyl-D-galactosamine dehydrogenase